MKLRACLTHSQQAHHGLLTRSTRCALLVIGCLLFVTSWEKNLAAMDWPQFRGLNSNGQGTGEPPVQFGPSKNVKWKSPVGPGHSSPCISGERIFLTSFDQAKRSVAVICLDRNSGEILWRQSRQVAQLESGHPSFNPASGSPCCDHKCVVAYFGSFGLICFDLEGTLLWEKQLPLAKSFGGNAASPIISGDRVILYRGNEVDHYLLCVDKATGEEQWKVPQDEEFTGEMACTACPIIADNKLICHTARSVQAFDVQTGDRVWAVKCATTATSTPIIANGYVIVAAWNKLGEPALRPPFPDFETLLSKQDRNENGLIEKNEFPVLWIFHRPEGVEAAMNGAKVSWRHADRNRDQFIEKLEWEATTADLERFRAGYETHGLLAIPLDSQGLVGSDQVKTLLVDGIPEVPSPVAEDNHVYLVKNGGLLTCLSLPNGDLVYRIRTGGKGTHYASPLIAAGKLYCTSGGGQVTVITTGPDPKILATNDLEDGVFATPLIDEGILYVRTHSALFAFEEPSK